MLIFLIDKINVVNIIIIFVLELKRQKEITNGLQDQVTTSLDQLSLLTNQYQSVKQKSTGNRSYIIFHQSRFDYVGLMYINICSFSNSFSLFQWKG